jgi:hypothetical protein
VDVEVGEAVRHGGPFIWLHSSAARGRTRTARRQCPTAPRHAVSDRLWTRLWKITRL